MFYILQDINEKLKIMLARSKPTCWATSGKEIRMTTCNTLTNSLSAHTLLDQVSTPHYLSQLIVSVSRLNSHKKDILPSFAKHIENIVPELSDDSDSEKEDKNDFLDENGIYRIPCMQLMFGITEKVLNYFATDKKKFEVILFYQEN